MCLAFWCVCTVCLSAGKFVPEEAVKEMKANYVLPSEDEQFVDDVTWVELSKEQSVPLVQRSVRLTHVRILYE